MDNAAKSAVMTAPQRKASQTSLPAGVSTKSARAASTIVVKGLFSANGCSQPGIVSTGTNADEMKVTGKRIVKPYAFAASGEDAESPMNANTHENAYPRKSSSTSPRKISPKLVEKRKPAAIPTPNMITSWR